MLNHIGHPFHRGDTLIEVMFAVGVFGLAAVGAISLMNRGLATAQNTLEVTMARQEIDGQAEILRFLHSAYLSSKDTISEEPCTSPKSYRDLWKCITSEKYVYTADKITDADGDFYSRTIEHGENCDSLFHADGKNYKDWDPQENGKDFGKYTMDGWMRNRYLSTSAYPYRNDSTGIVNEALTNESDPAAILYNENTDGQMYMSKPVTNIRVGEDGIVSFDFMTDPSGIDHIFGVRSELPDVWYDLQGRRLQGKPQRKGLYIHNGQKESIR